jgi:UDP-GlcNAc:undecaprenyl-phosphate GlcNAc-1-phosphate transferase
MSGQEYMNTYPSIANLAIFGGSIFLSWAMTWALLRWKGPWGVDRPDDRRKHHERPISRLGGLPIFIALLTGFFVMELRFPSFMSRWWPLVVTNLIIFAVGFIDDLKPQGAKVKLIGQIGTATILYAFGVSIDTLTNPFGSEHFDLGWWSFPVTVLWLVTVPNIVNLIDGMDGLAAGFGMFLCLTLAVVGHYTMQPQVVTVSVIMGGALTGFLYFNFPPARIFLGDGGSYLIGFFIASVSLFTSNKGTVFASLLVVIIALGVPILDTLFTIVRRAVRGVPIFRADAEHIHHRLITLGFSQTRALVAIYSICLVLSLIGISIFWTRASLPIAGAALVVLGLVAARYLGYVKSWRDIRFQFREALARRREMLYCGTWGRVLEWESERCGNLEEFLPLLKLGLTRMGFSLAPGPDLVKMKISLVTQETVVLYRHSDIEHTERWLAKADLLAPALNLATERWGTLPGLEIIPGGAPRPDTLSSPPADQPTC